MNMVDLRYTWTSISFLLFGIGFMNFWFRIMKAEWRNIPGTCCYLYQRTRYGFLITCLNNESYLCWISEISSLFLGNLVRCYLKICDLKFLITTGSRVLKVMFGQMLAEFHCANAFSLSSNLVLSCDDVRSWNGKMWKLESLRRVKFVWRTRPLGLISLMSTSAKGFIRLLQFLTSQVLLPFFSFTNWNWIIYSFIKMPFNQDWLIV